MKKWIIALTLVASTLIPTATQATAKEKTYKDGRTEFYTAEVGNVSRAETKEINTEGLECTITIDAKTGKGNYSGNSNWYKYSNKAKGNKYSKTDNDICEFAQKNEKYQVSYEFSGKQIVWRTGDLTGFVTKQGYKNVVRTSKLPKNIVEKYKKKGFNIGNRTNVIFTHRVINHKNIPNKKVNKDIKKDFVRSSTIKPSQVIFNNLHIADGRDRLTVTGLKKGTRLSVYKTDGVLYKEVEAKGNSYTFTFKEYEDILDVMNGKKGRDTILISQRKPNEMESFRLPYKIPKQKKQVHALTFGEHSEMYQGKKGVGSVSKYVIKEDNESGTSFGFTIEDQPQDVIYKIKKDNKVVHEINMKKEDFKQMKNYGTTKNPNYEYDKTIMSDASEEAIKFLQAKDLKEAKRYTFTATKKGLKESKPLPFYEIDEKEGTFSYDEGIY